MRQFCILHLPFTSQAKALLQAINLQGIFNTLTGPTEGIKLSHISIEVKGNYPTTSLGAGSRSQFVQFRNEGRVVCLCMQAQTNIDC